MTAFKKRKGDWNVFRESFLGLMADRKIENQFKGEAFDGSCLLCSEDKPHQCHRSLVVDYLNDNGAAGSPSDTCDPASGGLAKPFTAHKSA